MAAAYPVDAGLTLDHQSPAAATIEAQPPSVEVPKTGGVEYRPGQGTADAGVGDAPPPMWGTAPYVPYPYTSTSPSGRCTPFPTEQTGETKKPTFGRSHYRFLDYERSLSSADVQAGERTPPSSFYIPRGIGSIYPDLNATSSPGEYVRDLHDTGHGIQTLGGLYAASRALVSSSSRDTHRPINYTAHPSTSTEPPVYPRLGPSSGSFVHDAYLCVDYSCAVAFQTGLTLYCASTHGVPLRVLPHMGTRANFISHHSAMGIVTQPSPEHDPESRIPAPLIVPLDLDGYNTAVTAHVSWKLPLGCDLVLGLDWMRSYSAFPDWDYNVLRFKTPFKVPTRRALPQWTEGRHPVM